MDHISTRLRFSGHASSGASTSHPGGTTSRLWARMRISHGRERTDYRDRVWAPLCVVSLFSRNLPKLERPLGFLPQSSASLYFFRLPVRGNDMITALSSCFSEGSIKASFWTLGNLPMQPIPVHTLPSNTAAQSLSLSLAKAIKLSRITVARLCLAYQNNKTMGRLCFASST